MLPDPLAGIWLRGEWFAKTIIKLHAATFARFSIVNSSGKLRLLRQSSLGHGPGKTERNQSRIMLSRTEGGLGGMAVWRANSQNRAAFESRLHSPT